MDAISLVLFVIMILLIIGDFVFTEINVRKYGPSAELVPFMRRHATKSIYQHAALKIILAVILIVFISLLNPIFAFFLGVTTFPFTVAGFALAIVIGTLCTAVYGNILSIWFRDP